MAHKTIERILELADFEARIFELVGPDSTDDPNNVPVDPRIDVAAITADDPDPMFVNVEVIRGGILSGNRRRYNNGVVRQLSEMIPGVQGFLGHPDPDKAGFEFREPHTIFVGGMTQEDEFGNVRALAKAYIFKTSPLREWIPKSIAAGNPMTVSINGTADVSRDSVNNVIEVLRMNRLDSIDWANPGTEGVYTSRAQSIVKEMLGGEEMDKNEVIKNVTIAELREQNPSLITEVENSARITEIAVVVNGTEEKVKITEMQTFVSNLETKHNETVNTLNTKVSDLETQIANMKISEMKNNKLHELVPAELIDKVSSRVTGTDDATITASIESELAYIQELSGNRYSNLPKGKPGRSEDNDMEEKVKNLFGVKK